MALNITYDPTPTGKRFMQSDARMRVIMGPVGCLGAETLVVTEFGLLPISQIDRPMRVLSLNEMTGQYQLSWCGGAYPKGRGYLRRVSTPRGEFAASAHHHVFCEESKYLPAQSLYPGQSLPQCSADLIETTASQYQKSSLADEDHLTQTVVGFLARYAELVRQYGQLPQTVAGNDLASSQVQGDVPRSALYCDWYDPSHTDAQMEQSQVRSHQDLHAYQNEIGDYVLPVEHLRQAVEDYTSAALSAHSVETDLAHEQSRQKIEHRPKGGLFPVCYGSYSTSTTNGTILAVEREEAKREYWDLQVLDTGNYVTADGTINRNSGKSVLCCFEIIRRASQQAPNAQGIRKSRCAVVRETVRQLSDTTIKTFLDWFPDGVCGHFMRTTKTYFLKIGDVECEIMFRALDDADDVANLNSLELTFAFFNECRDIHPTIVDAMSKRIGRFPSKKDGGPTWHGMWADTNPPVMDTWWYYQMEKLSPEDGVSANDNGWDVFKQPSGRSPKAENIENLPDDYYSTQGRSDDYIRVFIDGEYGHSLAGTPVYKFFQPGYHISQGPLRHISNGIRPIVVGIDLGLTPAAVIGQMDPRGRLLILAEAAAFDMGIQRFSRTVLRPLLAERFPGMKAHLITDPAGMQRAQTDEKSAVDILKQEGFSVIPAKTNNISARLNAVDDYLMRQVDGDPAFLLDYRCTHLKAAMMGGYRFHAKNGNIDKNSHSHIAEALQYLALHANGLGESVGVQRKVIKSVDSRGWT